MNFSKRKIFLDSVVYTLLPKVSVLASLLILPWVTPYLTLIDYGIFGLLMAYITIFQNIIVMGQNILLQNSFFTHKSHYKLVWKRSFAMMILAGVVSSIIFGMILYFLLWSKLGHNAIPILVIVSLYFILSPLDTIVVNYYVLKEKSLPYAFGAALTGIVATSITLITIKYFRMGYMGWIISLLIASIMSYLYYFRRIFLKERLAPEFRFKKLFFIKALKIGLPLTPHQLSLYILGISDRLLLEYFHIPIKQIGFYSQGYNMGSQGSVVVTGFFQALSKKLQEGFRGDDESHRIFIKRAIIFVPLLISAILFLAGIWTKEIFFFLFRNPELRLAYPVAIIVICSYMFGSIYTFLTYPLIIKNQTFSVSKISIFAALFNIAGNIILIPYYGIWAAMGTTYFSYIILGFAGLLNKENRLFLNKYINIVKLCIFLICINVIMFVVAYLSKDLSIAFKALITIILLGGSALFIKQIFINKSKYAIPNI